MAQGAALKTAIAEATATTDRCPRNGEAGIDMASSHANGIVAGITAALRADGHCGLDIALRAPRQPQLDAHTIRLSFDRDTSRWDCRTDPARRFVGSSCAAPNLSIGR